MLVERRHRRLYSLAMAWNVAVGLAVIVAPAWAVSLTGLTPPGGALAEYNGRSLGCVLVLFGALYFEIGRDLVAGRRFLAIAIAAKLVSVVLGVGMALVHPELWRLVGGAAVVDLVFAALFARDFQRTGRPAAG